MKQFIKQTASKTSFLSFAALTMMVVQPVTSANAAVVSGFAIKSCTEDFEDVNFCSRKFIRQYKRALRKPVNFNHSYVLQILKPSKYGFSEVVAINPASKRVIPLGVEIKPRSKVRFSKNSNTFCFAGQIEGYRMSNEGNHICYKLGVNEYGIDFTNISYNR